MAKVTLSKQFGNASLIPEYYKKLGDKTMIDMVKNLTKATIPNGWLPFNLKVYVKNGANFNYKNPMTELGIKVDAIYMGSSWGLLKIVIEDLINQYKYKLRWWLLKK